jgi:hypothetical protein
MNLKNLSEKGEGGGANKPYPVVSVREQYSKPIIISFFLTEAK